VWKNVLKFEYLYFKRVGFANPPRGAGGPAINPLVSGKLKIGKNFKIGTSTEGRKKGERRMEKYAVKRDNGVDDE
jgi:hypothetical protein